MSNEDNNADDDGYTTYPQVTQHPHSIVVGDEIVDIVTSATIDSNTEDTGTGIGVVFKNPTVPKGSVWKQRDIPGDYHDSAAEFNADLKVAFADDGDYVNGVEVDEVDIGDAVVRIDAALGEGNELDTENDQFRDYRLPVDYKIADKNDRDVEVQTVEFDGETKTTGIDVGGGSFQSTEVESFDHDEVMVWYGGMAGQFILRALDINGLPSARYKDDGYLVKGVLQHPLGWFDRDTENYNVDSTDRSKLARDASNGGLGRPPRVVRPLILQKDLEGESVFIGIDRYNGGRMLEATTAYNDFEGDDYESATDIDLHYEPEIDDIICEEFDVDDPTEVYELYHGDGWQPKIDGGDEGNDTDTSGASFDVSMGDDEDESDDSGVDHPTEDEQQFGQMISEQIAGRTDADPDDDIFEGADGKTDLEGLVGLNAEQFSVTPDVDAIRTVVYSNTDHLNTGDL
ncbi:hypothetical protein [Natrinema sp. DC36]|uniref:hypothetical protein n=1 Tax=Natrinema sp. DC36 TaxID=2878680 RepID=UPI001CEFF2C0|nr:hypothetical protein [Natrinema sp. DC36]